MSLPGQKFLSAEFREIVKTSAVVEEPAYYKEPIKATIWLVATWYTPHGEWKVREEQWSTSEMAHQHARNLVEEGVFTKAVVFSVGLE